MPRVYLSPPDLAGNELDLLREALSSNWIAPLGPHVDAFEAEAAERLALPHALALSSGTAALHLALEVLGVKAGDEVWMSTLTFIATANPASYLGAIPVFIDSDRASWNMNPGLLAEALADAARRNKLPKAVVVVDLYGQSAEMDVIAAECRHHGVALVEDAAEALGATFAGRPVGTHADLTILSFNGNKIITTSGGGMLLGHRKQLLDRARYLSTQARLPAAHYEHDTVGYNYRMSNLLAAVGRAQLADLDRRVEARRGHYAHYKAALGGLPGWSFMPEAPRCRSTFWLTCATVDPQTTIGRDAFIARLSAEDIEARPVWKPMHSQPLFRGARVIGGAVADELFANGICLPSGSSLTETDRARVTALLRGAA